MPFATVESVGERDALIMKFLKNHETLRKRVVDEKVGKQTFQREVAAELQKPVVEQQQALEEERQKKRDERQNPLIAKLQENQEAITDKLDDQEAVTKRTLQAKQRLLQRVPQQPSLATAAETQQPAAEQMTLDPDAGLDLDLLKEKDLQPISKLTSRSLKDLESLHKRIQSPLKSLAGSKKGANFSEEDNQKFENFKRYNQSLKALIQGKKPQSCQQGLAKG